jgi:hypothetical protein
LLRNNGNDDNSYNEMKATKLIKDLLWDYENKPSKR